MNPLRSRAFGSRVLPSMLLVFALAWFGVEVPRTSAGSAPTIISPTSATTVVDQTFNYQIVLANFATGTYSASGLPAGLALDPGSGVISGAPSVVATSVIELSATNPDGTANSTLTLTVEPAGPPVISSATTASLTVGQAFSYQIVANNFPTLYGATSLPAGLVVNPQTGLISGVPTSAGDFTFIVSAANVRGTGTASFKLAVAPTLPVVALTTVTPTADPLHGDTAQFILTRTGGDLSQPLTVVFAVKGSARNGVDYQLLPLAKTIKAGKTSKRLTINALDPQASSGSTKGVKIHLQPSDAYQLDATASAAKIKLIYEP